MYNRIYGLSVEDLVVWKFQKEIIDIQNVYGIY